MTLFFCICNILSHQLRTVRYFNRFNFLLNLLNFITHLALFFIVNMYGLDSVGHINSSHKGFQVIDFSPMGCSKLFHIAFAAEIIENIDCDAFFSICLPDVYSLPDMIANRPDL